MVMLDALKALAGSSSSPALSPFNPLSDFAENGWPKQEVLSKLNDGARYGHGTEDWSGEVVHGERFLHMKLACAGGSLHVLMDTVARTAAFRAGADSFEGGFEEAASRIALATQRHGAALRASDSVSLRRGAWQHSACVAAIEAPAGRAGFHSEPGEDPRDSWERKFDDVYAHCEKKANPTAEMEKIRGQFFGSAQKDIQCLVDEAVADKSNRVAVAGETAAIASIGVQGAQIRVAIPLKADGSVAPNLPMMAVLVRELDGKAVAADPRQEPMRFYHQGALASWISGAQSMEMAGPVLAKMTDKLASWRSSRELADPALRGGVEGLPRATSPAR